MKKNLPKLEKNVEKEIKQEEHIIFHHFIHLKKHHQVLFAIIITCGIIFVWRGIWDLIRSYWFPKNLLFSDISGIIIGLILLYLSHEISKKLA